MPLYADPKGRFSLEIPEAWRPTGEAAWMPQAGDDPVHLYDHTSMSGGRTLGVQAAYRMRPGCRVYALEASRRTLMLDGCPAERIAWVEEKEDDRLWAIVSYAVDLGDAAIDLHLFAQSAETPAAPELDAAITSFRCLRDPMQPLSGQAQEAYRGRIAATLARLADPSLRDDLDETIDEIAGGLGRRALARKREIAALTPEQCRLDHPELGTMTFDPEEEQWTATLALPGAPVAIPILVYTEMQPTFAAEREAVLTGLGPYAERLRAVAARWTWASLTDDIAGRIAPGFNESWRDEDAFPEPLPVSEIARRLEEPSGLAMDAATGPQLTLYFKAADDLFWGHQVDAVMEADGSIAVCGLAG